MSLKAMCWFRDSAPESLRVLEVGKVWGPPLPSWGPSHLFTRRMCVCVCVCVGLSQSYSFFHISSLTVTTLFSSEAFFPQAICLSERQEFSSTEVIGVKRRDKHSPINAP